MCCMTRRKHQQMATVPPLILCLHPCPHCQTKLMPPKGVSWMSRTTEGSLWVARFHVHSQAMESKCDFGNPVDQAMFFRNCTPQNHVFLWGYRSPLHHWILGFTRHSCAASGSGTGDGVSPKNSPQTPRTYSSLLDSRFGKVPGFRAFPDTGEFAWYITQSSQVHNIDLHGTMNISTGGSHQSWSAEVNPKWWFSKGMLPLKA